MRLVTPELVMSFGPCDRYSEKEICELLGYGLPLQNVMRLPVPAVDKLWLILREEFISQHDMHDLAFMVSMDVLPIFEREHPGDNTVRCAIETKRAWLRRDATDEQLQNAICDLRRCWSGKHAASRFSARAAFCFAAGYSTVDVLHGVLDDAAMAADLDRIGEDARYETYEKYLSWALEAVKEEWK